MNLLTKKPTAFAHVMRVLVPALAYPALVHVLEEASAKMSFMRKILHSPEIPMGRYTYRGTGKFAGMALQLRIEQHGRGVMVINANAVLHLNETASAYAYFFMQDMHETDV